MIKNLHKKYYSKDSYTIEGTVWAEFLGKEIDVRIDDETLIEYAEKCAQAMNSLSDETIDTLCEAAKKYCLWMAGLLAETGGSLYDEEWYDMKTKVDESLPAREILKSVWLDLVVEKPKDNSIGYSLNGACGWEPEHGFSAVIKDNKVLYVGADDGITPWYSYFPTEEEGNFVN